MHRRRCIERCRGASRGSGAGGRRSDDALGQRQRFGFVRRRFGRRNGHHRDPWSEAPRGASDRRDGRRGTERLPRTTAAPHVAVARSPSRPPSRIRSRRSRRKMGKAGDAWGTAGLPVSDPVSGTSSIDAANRRADANRRIDADQLGRPTGSASSTSTAAPPSDATVVVAAPANTTDVSGTHGSGGDGVRSR